MDFSLTDVEVRILGSLIEKEITTPEYYPLTLNSLLAACNQKSNRDPVMNLDESAVTSALESLKKKHLVWHLTTSSRATKYDHNLRTVLPLAPAEFAVLCTLMLRGPQTIGEIRTRTERMHPFASLEQVQETLQSMIQRQENPVAIELPRQPGRKENRYAHLLAGKPSEADMSAAPAAVPEQPPAPERPANESIQFDQLKDEMRQLRNEFDQLRKAFNEFRTEQRAIRQ